jgi:diacylglycerol kinase family enzyme
MSANRHAVLVVNPFATRVNEACVERVKKALAPVALVDVLLTERPGHAIELVARASREGADAVLVYSGDGGFNEALNGVDGRVPLGFVPGGSSNVLPRALGLPNDPVAAAHRLAGAIAEGRTRKISVGRVNGRRFGFSAGIGLDAEAVRWVEAHRDDTDGKRPGDFAFALAVVRAVLRHGGRMDPQLEVKSFGRAAFAFVANTNPYTYAKRLPLPIAAEARFELGLDVVAPVRIRRLSLPATAVAILSGRARGESYIYGHDLDRVDIICDRPLPLHADGEDLGDVDEAVFKAERGAISVLA